MIKINLVTQMTDFIHLIFISIVFCEISIVSESQPTTEDFLL